MDTERVAFEGHHGDELSGTLHHAEDARGAVLLAHCFTCSQDLAVNVRIARVLAERGYRVLRFDFTGLGRSEGDFRESTLSANVGDLVQASEWMAGNGLGPTGLVGHSLGGIASLIAASRIDTLESMAVVNAPSSAEHVLRHLATDEVEAARETGCVEVELAGRSFPISDDLIEDLQAFDEDEVLETLGLPLAVVHSTEDRTVSISEGEHIFAKARQPKTFVPIIGGDHLLTDEGRGRRAADVVADWLDATGAGDRR